MARFVKELKDQFAWLRYLTHKQNNKRKKSKAYSFGDVEFNDKIGCYLERSQSAPCIVRKENKFNERKLTRAVQSLS